MCASSNSPWHSDGDAQLWGYIQNCLGYLVFVVRGRYRHKGAFFLQSRLWCHFYGSEYKALSCRFSTQWATNGPFLLLRSSVSWKCLLPWFLSYTHLDVYRLGNTGWFRSRCNFNHGSKQRMCSAASTNIYTVPVQVVLLLSSVVNVIKMVAFLSLCDNLAINWRNTHF